MINYTEQLMYGLKPVHREEPQASQSEYYYFDPRYGDDDARHVVDVPDGTSPNPNADAIQQYLYENDEYRYKNLYGDTPPPSVQTQSNNAPNCYVEFNGQDVDLYKYGQYDGTRLQNGQLQDNLNGQSGGDDYQSRIHQDVPDKGPIPEGTYYANQDRRQNITALDAAAGIIGHGKWPGSLPAWGTKRVWLQPDANTNTYGRSGFTIHGGWSKGSAGCIDIPWQTGKLSNYLDECQDSVPVYVKYPKDW